MFHRIVVRTLIFWGIFPAVSHSLSARQMDGDTIVVSEKVGKVIDPEERDRYGLFRSYHGFRSAVLLKKQDGGYVFEVIREDTVAHRDVAVKFSPTEEQVQQLREYIEGPAQKPVPVVLKKHGEWISVGLKDGKKVEGELLAAGDGRLFLGDSSLSAVMEVEIDRAALITAPKEARFFQCIGRGFFSGGMFGLLIGFAGGNDEPGWFSMTAGQKALAAGLSLGILGAAIGAVIGVFTGIDESIDPGTVPHGQMHEIMEKLAAWARYGREMPPDSKTYPLMVPEKIPAEKVQPPPESATGKTERHFPDAPRSAKFSRFHFNYTPRYFRFQGQSQWRGVLEDLGFAGTVSYTGLFGSGTTEYPHELEDPVLFFRDCSFDFSASRKFTLGISYESLGRHGTTGRRAIGDAETFLTGFFEGRSWFMTASYFPVPDAFTTKNSVKLTAGMGYGNVRMDFYGSETYYGYESPIPGVNTTTTSLSKYASAYLLSAEWNHFFNRRWSLGLNAGYKWIPVKTDRIPVDCAYSVGWDYTASQMRHEVLGVVIPARTWNFGGFGVGLHFGFHL
jgi:hypothetical protein